ncbi:ATP-binding protein [Streptomyces sp. NPDC006997]|uniref:sensor histidine kinase n=1 Tax=Streptomyces sp. NPDC006997 TaxID=3155356 RepID=UPI0033C0F67A
MVSVQPPPLRRDLPEGRVFLVPAIVMAAATGAAVALVVPSARVVVGACGAVAVVLLLAVSAEAVRRGRVVRNVQAEHSHYAAYLERRWAAQHDVLARFTDDIVPAAFEKLKTGESPVEALRQLREEDERFQYLPGPLEVLLKRVMFIVDTEDAIRDSLARSFVDVARRIQALIHQQAHELREMEEDHGTNPRVFDDLLRIDHGTSLMGRLADTVSVLGGGRPGRQWPLPVSLYSTLRGAMSRILEYRRITLSNIARISVKGIYVEPVIHACAELFDNATRYSPPNSKVHVTAVAVQTGVAIEIEDGGISFNEEARARCEGMLERAMQGIDIQDLDQAPRLGLAVVGRLCKSHNMRVSLRPSAYGGVRAVLVVPHALLTTERGVGLAHGIGATSLPILSDEIPQGPQRPPKKRRPSSPKKVPSTALHLEEEEAAAATERGIPAAIDVPAPAPPSEDDDPIVTEWTATGLPQRRSRVVVPPHELRRRAYIAQAEEQEAAEKAAREGRTVPEPAPEPKEEQPPPGLWVEAFFEGLKRDPSEYESESTPGPTEEPVGPEAADERDPK